MGYEVCHFAAATHLGGAERSMLEGIEELARARRCRSWVLLPRAEGPLVDALRHRGLAHEVLEMPPSLMQMSRRSLGRLWTLAPRAVPEIAGYLARLIALLEVRRPAILHTNGIKPHVLSALLPRRLGPVVWHLRDVVDGPMRPVLAGLARWRADHVIAISHAVRGTIDCAGGAEVTVVHNGISSEQYRRRPNRQFNARLGVADDVPIVGIVGALTPLKGQREFLHMAARLAQQGVRARFVVIGDAIYDNAIDDAYRHELRREVVRLGIADRVAFAGFRLDAVDALNGLDLLVHASVRPEAFGRVVVEAMACGVPVVASSAGGVAEVVDEASGMLVPPGDVAAMAAAVAALLRDPGRRATMVDSARRRFEQHFTLARSVAGWLEIYERVLS